MFWALDQSVEDARNIECEGEVSSSESTQMNEKRCFHKIFKIFFVIISELAVKDTNQYKKTTSLFLDDLSSTPVINQHLYRDTSVMSVFIFSSLLDTCSVFPNCGLFIPTWTSTSFSNSTCPKCTSIFSSLSFLLTFLFLHGSTLLLRHSCTISKSSLIPLLPILCSLME